MLPTTTCPKLESGCSWSASEEERLWFRPENEGTPPTVGEILRRLPPFGRAGNDSICAAKVVPAAKPVMRPSAFKGSLLFNGSGRPLDLSAPAKTLPASMGGNATPISPTAPAGRWIRSLGCGIPRPSRKRGNATAFRPRAHATFDSRGGRCVAVLPLGAMEVQRTARRSVPTGRQRGSPKSRPLRRGLGPRRFGRRGRRAAGGNDHGKPGRCLNLDAHAWWRMRSPCCRA